MSGVRGTVHRHLTHNNSKSFFFYSDDSFSEERNSQEIEEILFELFKNESGKVVVSKFINALEQTGLRKMDPRLKEMLDVINQLYIESDYSSGSPESMELDLEEFRMAVKQNIVLITRALREQFRIPQFKDFCKIIEKLFWKCKPIDEGQVADYIPQLAVYDPNYWGASLCTVDGQRFSVGDTNIPFTLQSTSKPITYSIALNELGPDQVHQYVGQEPSGRMFNELVLDYSRKPHNPMINAGSIMVCSLIHTICKKDMNRSEKFEFTENYFKKLAGGEYIGFSNSTFLSERDSADRNYALGYFMREHKCFPENCNLIESLDYYFQCCALEGNCESLSVIAGTLANGGICPITGERILGSDAVRDVLSLMHSCGMYDYSGQFAFKVGLPAKSGVSGALMLVVPTVMGMGLWSPPLDSMGNSVRGIKFCHELVSTFSFHRYDSVKHSTRKLDPRRHKYETQGLNVITLLFGAASGDVTAMRRHLLSGMNMDQQDYDNRTPLHLAAVEGHLDCVKFLVEQCKVQIDTKDRWGHTPYEDAKRFGHENVAQYLLECQENANALASEKESTMME